MEPRSGPMSIILSSGTSEASVVTQVQFEAGLLPPSSAPGAMSVSPADPQAARLSARLRTSRSETVLFMKNSPFGDSIAPDCIRLVSPRGDNYELFVNSRPQRSR